MPTPKLRAPKSGDDDDDDDDKEGIGFIREATVTCSFPNPSRRTTNQP